MLAVAVLAAFGAKWLWSILADRRRLVYLIAVAISLLIIIEYLSVPIPSISVPVKNKIPEVYKWLAAKDGDMAIIELPLPQHQQSLYLKEAPRVYYSVYHWKKLVNGYSGYFPPLYRELQQRWRTNSLEQNIKDLIDLRVKYLILHSSLYEEKKLKDILLGLSKLKKEVKFVEKLGEKLKKEVKFVEKLGEAYVYELNHPEQQEQKRISLDRTKPLSKKGWKANSNVHKRKTLLAIDGNMSTRWNSGPQKKGIFFELDLGRPYQIRGLSLKLGPKYFRGLSLKLGPKYLDYPRAYYVDLSTDKINWTTVASQEKTSFPLTAFIKGSTISLDIPFSPTPARYIKITNTGEDKTYYWSIYELDVFE